MNPRAPLLFVLLLAGPADAQSPDTCVGVQVGSEHAYDCVNAALADLVRSAHGARGTNTLTATSPAPAVGTFDQTATAERMGNAFGRSVIAQRPAPPGFALPVPR